MLPNPLTPEPTRLARDRRGAHPDLRALLAELTERVEAGLPVNALPLARVIGVSGNTIYTLIREGKVRALRIGERRLVIPACEARRLLQLDAGAHP